jgi:hypothetical protein
MPLALWIPRLEYEGDRTMKWLICAIPDEAQAKMLEDRLRNIGPVLYTRDENGNVKNGHHDLANIMFIDQADIREIPA